MMRHGASTLACTHGPERLMPTRFGRIVCPPDKRPHEWGRGRQECLRHVVRRGPARPMGTGMIACAGSFARSLP